MPQWGVGGHSQHLVQQLLFLSSIRYELRLAPFHVAIFTDLELRVALAAQYLSTVASTKVFPADSISLIARSSFC